MDSERVHVKFPGFRRPLFSGRFSRCAGVRASNTSGYTLPFSCCALTFACREHKHNQLLRLPSAKPLRSVPQSGAELVPPQIQRPRAARYASYAPAFGSGKGVKMLRSPPTRCGVVGKRKSTKHSESGLGLTPTTPTDNPARRTNVTYFLPSTHFLTYYRTEKHFLTYF